MNEQLSKNARKIILEFIENELPNKKIEDFKYYSFLNIKNKKFDNQKGYPDGDCTKIVYAIDYLLYADISDDFKIPDYPNSSEKDCNFIGETINTFNTIFSKDEDNRKLVKSLFTESDWKLIIDEDNRDKPFGDDYFHIYQNLGNFMLLPSRTLFGKSLNNYRGDFYGWKDYFYIFMENLKKSYNEKNITSDKNKQLYELYLLKNENAFFFNHISFEDFIEKFYLQGYKNLRTVNNKYVNWKDLLKNRDKQDIKIVLEFIENAKEFIKNRSEVLVKILKDKLNDTDFPNKYLS